MNILITGASGYLGSQLKLELTKIGHNVVPLDLHDKINPVDLSNYESLRSLRLPKEFTLIHLAFPLPGSQKSRDFIRKITNINYNVTSILKPRNTLLMSSTAIYALNGKKEEPWEVYGRLKLETEKIFIASFNNVAIFRPGTLIQEGRMSAMMKYLTRLRTSSFPILPGNGDFIHPFTYTPDLINSIKRWTLDPGIGGVHNIIAREPISLREICYLDRVKRVAKEIRLPSTALKLVGLDSYPLFGISKWHLRALTYDLRELNTSHLSDETLSYSEIFRRLSLFDRS